MSSLFTKPDLAAFSAEERVRWAVEQFGDKLILSTSFGIQSAVMLHLATSILPRIPVVFIDTGYHFPETYRFADELTKRLDLNLRVYAPRLSPAYYEARHGKRWEQGIEGLAAYNFDHKVEPMDRGVRELGATAWLAGLRRTQGSTRENLEFAQVQNKITKVHPILDWDNRAIYRYLVDNDLPYHPLWDQGYVSIGDKHSSSPLQPGQSEEDTRFGGLKRECGLHEISGRSDFSI
jgi:phosphoadenosine phosphosulfate reductase